MPSRLRQGNCEFWAVSKYQYKHKSLKKQCEDLGKEGMDVPDSLNGPGSRSGVLFLVLVITSLGIDLGDKLPY